MSSFHPQRREKGAFSNTTKRGKISQARFLLVKSRVEERGKRTGNPDRAKKKPSIFLMVGPGGGGGGHIHLI